MPDEAEDNQRSRVRKLFDAGAELVGATAGATVGLFTVGPEGALIGAAAGPVMTAALREFSGRVLSRREEVRIGATWRYAVAAIEELSAAGEELRSDDFFTSTTSDRTSADEVVEGVLRSAQQQHEERKVEFLGYLLANIAFHQEIDKHLAGWLTNAAGELTWMQFCLIAAVGQHGTTFTLPAGITIGTNNENWHSRGVHEQLEDIGYYRRGLIGRPVKRSEYNCHSRA